MPGESTLRKRLLIVDDDPAVLEALSFALEDDFDIQPPPTALRVSCGSASSTLM